MPLIFCGNPFICTTKEAKNGIFEKNQGNVTWSQKNARKNDYNKIRQKTILK